jgi:IS5 family transposase
MPTEIHEYAAKRLLSAIPVLVLASFIVFGLVRLVPGGPVITMLGADADSGLVHSVIGTAGNVADVTQASGLLHGAETAVLGDAGYQGVDKREEHQDRAVTWHIAMGPGKRKALGQDKLGRMHKDYERAKARVRAKVEHPFHVVKNLFRHRKTRYRGLAKNEAQLFSLFAMANLVLARPRLLASP